MTSRTQRISETLTSLQERLTLLRDDIEEEFDEEIDTILSQRKQIETLEGQNHRMLGRLVDIREAMRLPPEGEGVVMSAEVLKAYHRVQDILNEGMPKP